MGRAWKHFAGWITGHERVAVLLIAIAFRLALLGLPAPEQVSRGLWDGLVQREGWNPYVISPHDPALAYLQNDPHVGGDISRQPAHAPPGQMLLFRLLALLEFSPLLARVLFLAADAGAILVLLRVMDLHGRHPRWALLYALHPASLATSSTPAAFLALGLALLLLMLKRNRATAAALGLALAVQFGHSAWLLAPFLFRRGHSRSVLAVALLSCAGYAAFAPGTAGLRQAWTEFACNPSASPIRAMLQGWDLEPQSLSLLLLGCLGLLTLAVRVRTPDAVTGGIALASVFMLLSPSPATAALTAFFLPLRPIRSVLLFSLTASALALLRSEPVAITTLLAYAPSLGLLAFNTLSGRFPAAAPDAFRDTHLQSVSVVVADDGTTCPSTLFEQLRQPSHPPLELVFVADDPGSANSRLAAAEGALVVNHSGSTAEQFAAGCYRAHGDVVLFLTPGTRIPHGILDNMLHRLNTSGKAGGALGVSGYRSRFQKLLRDLTAGWAGYYDHRDGLFVRKAWLEAWGGYPSQPGKAGWAMATQLRSEEPPLYLWGKGR